MVYNNDYTLIKLPIWNLLKNIFFLFFKTRSFQLLPLYGITRIHLLLALVIYILLLKKKKKHVLCGRIACFFAL